jgi:hypothetical protein
LLLSTLALVLLAGACDDDFTPYVRLNKLRVLAVAAEPARPGPGETTTLTPLIYVPPGMPVSRRWSWCPMVGEAGRGYPCLVDEGTAAAWAGAGTPLPPFDLGTGETATFPHQISADLLRALCTGAVNGVPLPALPDCSAGFPITVRLTVQTAGDQVVTVRTLHLRFDPAQQPNQNPVVDQLLVGDGAGQRPLEGATIPAQKSAETPIAALVPEAAAEAYSDRDDQGRPMAAREQLTLTWFVEAGEPEHHRTSFIEGSIPLPQASRNQWTFPDREEAAPDGARLILVLRDNRGGVGWREASVRLTYAGGQP